jgi:anti-sigma28 factor (negative regulator of flagellin synthesis)
MRISDAEVKKVLSRPTSSVVEAIVELEEVRRRDQNRVLVQNLAVSIDCFPDREELVAELRKRVEAGTYQVSAEEIVECMVRRAIADNIK